jgi:S-DNA-T family DNA segregation ATPase FtsK/SpoIIIE
MLERRAIISGYEGSKPRQVLVSEAELPRTLERISGGGEPDDDDGDGAPTESELEALSP